MNYFMEYGLDTMSGKNKIVIELEDTDVVNALSDLQGLDKEARESIYDFMEFVASKKRG